MNYSTHYNLNLAEGTDLVNPLTVDVPNYQTIDSTMYANEQAGVGSATELKSGTIHAITRANTNRNVFRFKSTSVFNVGDTFTVDGGSVTALYPDGSTLKDRCFIIGSDVLCLLDGAQLTVLATYYPEAQNVPFDDTNVSYTATNVQTAIENASTAVGTEYSTGVSVKDKLDTLDSTGPKTVYNENNDQPKSYTFADWSTYLVTIQKGGSLPSLALLSKMAGSNPAQITWIANNYGSSDVSIAGNTITCSASGSYYQMCVVKL